MGDGTSRMTEKESEDRTTVASLNSPKSEDFCREVRDIVSRSYLTFLLAIYILSMIQSWNSRRNWPIKRHSNGRKYLSG